MKMSTVENTRFQGDIDTVTIPGVRCHQLDPSQQPEYSPFIPVKGAFCKTIFDFTVPFHMKDKFQRAKFKEADVRRFVPSLFEKSNPKRRFRICR